MLVSVLSPTLMGVTVALSMTMTVAVSVTVN
jgi:hypothetical protein